jgi:hypothetical protein
LSVDSEADFNDPMSSRIAHVVLHFAHFPPTPRIDRTGVQSRMAIG